MVDSTISCQVTEIYPQFCQASQIAYFHNAANKEISLVKIKYDNQIYIKPTTKTMITVSLVPVIREIQMVQIDVFLQILYSLNTVSRHIQPLKTSQVSQT